MRVTVSYALARRCVRTRPVLTPHFTFCVFCSLFMPTNSFLAKPRPLEAEPRPEWDGVRAGAPPPGDAFDGNAPPPGTPLGDLLQELATKEAELVARLASSLHTHDHLLPSSVKAAALRLAAAQFAAVREKILDAAARMCAPAHPAPPLEADAATSGLPSGMVPATAGESEEAVDDDGAEPDGVDSGTKRMRVRVRARAVSHCMCPGV